MGEGRWHGPFLWSLGVSEFAPKRHRYTRRIRACRSRSAHPDLSDLERVAQVKFVLHQLFYATYIVLLPMLLMRAPMSEDSSWALPPSRIDGELAYWVWSIAILFAEVEQLIALSDIPDDSFGISWQRLREGTKCYLRDPWNVADIFTNTLIVASVLPSPS